LGWGVLVVARADLPSPLPPSFFVGNPTYYHLCMGGARWRELRGQPGTRKMRRARIAVVNEAECDREPWLPTLDELEEHYRVHGFNVPYKRPV
jgi:hypothetical protein